MHFAISVRFIPVGNIVLMQLANLTDRGHWCLIRPIFIGVKPICCPPKNTYASGFVIDCVCCVMGSAQRQTFNKIKPSCIEYLQKASNKL
jgi:hypothetical protein